MNAICGTNIGANIPTIVLAEKNPECVQYCGLNKTGSYGAETVPKLHCIPSKSCQRLSESIYDTGVSRIILENTIHFIPPEGEICYGDTIDTCTTVSVILENNSKIGIHLNPMNILAGEEPPLNIGSYAPKADVTYKNMFDEINKLKGEKLIKAIYVIGNPNIMLFLNDHETLGESLEIRNAEIGEQMYHDPLTKITVDSISLLYDLFKERLGISKEKEIAFIYQEGIELWISKRKNDHLIIRPTGIIDGSYRIDGEPIMLNNEILPNKFNIDIDDNKDSIITWNL